MNRVLIQTVGTGGPNNPVWEALAFTVRERQPNRILWLCSQQTKEETLPKVKRAIRDLLPQDPRDPRPASESSTTETSVAVCDDPSNVERLYSEYSRLIGDMRREMPDARIEVDYTSGTKAMSAAAVLAGIAHAVDCLHYAVGPYDETGRVTKTERLVSINPIAPVIDQQIGELGRLFNLTEFDAVRQQISAIRHRAQEPQQHRRLNSLDLLAKAYSLWDRFDWSGALHILRDADRKESVRESGWDTGMLQQQAKHLYACNTWNSANRLTDLLANAQRCISRGRFDDAVARLYRLTEYIGQVRFAKQFEINKENPTSNVSLEKLKRRAPQAASEHESESRQSGNEKVVNLGLRATIDVLAEVGDPVGQLAKRLYDPPDPSRPEKKGPLGELLDRRNESLLGHGNQPVSKDIAEQLATQVEKILREHLISDLLLPAQFLRCPWVL
jgi:CRISPR-associated protein (TIGR02710 family)